MKHRSFDCKWLIVLPLFLISCSSGSKSLTPENSPDEILSRIDDLSSRPKWLKESEPFTIENGTVTSLGQTTIPGDNRVEAGYRIAENSAKAAIAGAIEQRLDFVFQNAEEGTGIDANQARYIGAESSKIASSSIRIGKRYWEKFATTSDSGQRLTRYRIFATVTMPEADFKRAIMDAISRAQGKVGLSEDFKAKVDKHWDQFVGNVPAPTPAPKEATPSK